MQRDRESENNQNTSREFRDWLVGETVSGLRKSKGNTEAIKSCVFLFLHRAYESHLEADEIVDLLGAKKPSIIDMAKLSEVDEEAVLTSYELLEPAISQMYE